ncbi:MAG: hypothetical protein HKN10_14140 [Myxococcales bacterium]|nr:hypothetical protein [Myxococcales bacterium]
MIKKPQYVEDQGGEVRVRSWLLALAFAMAATSYQHGAILQHNTARGGFTAFKFDRTAKDVEQYEQLIALRDLIPPEAKIAGTERVLPHVSNRPDAYTVRSAGIQDAEYILFPFHIGGVDVERIRPVLVDESFGVVDVSGKFVLARRGHSTERNEEVLKRVRKPRKPRKPRTKTPPPKPTPTPALAPGPATKKSAGEE